MAKINYKKLGFKAGLEIHQQLDTKKLFCNCDSVIKKERPDFTFTRKLRAAAGETGEIDIAAEHEQKKDKYFLYHAYDDVNCLIELDEEPPKPINEQALKISLQVCRLLNAKIVDEIQVMRKTVVDGSNVSGFQRTALVGRNGYIETSKGRVSVPTICLEEEAAQAIKRTKEHDIYNLSRLGIPLIEIATGTEIKDAEHAKEVAEKIGMILRSTGKVKRGIGTIRQDVNLSIKHGARTEIKGFQELKSIPKVVDKEIERQLSAVRKNKKLRKEVRKVEQDFTTSFLRPLPGAARMYPETDILSIKPDLKDIKVPKLLVDKIIELVKKYKLNKDLAGLIIKNNISFENYVKKYSGIKPLFIVETLINTPKEIKRRYNIEIDVEKYSDEIFSKLNKNLISKEAVIDILVDLGKGKKVDYSKYKEVSHEEIKNEIKKIIKTKKGLSLGAYMGILMSKYRGKIDGKKVIELLKKNLK